MLVSVDGGTVLLLEEEVGVERVKRGGRLGGYGAWLLFVVDSGAVQLRSRHVVGGRCGRSRAFVVAVACPVFGLLPLQSLHNIIVGPRLVRLVVLRVFEQDFVHIRRGVSAICSLL